MSIDELVLVILHENFQMVLRTEVVGSSVLHKQILEEVLLEYVIVPSWHSPIQLFNMKSALFLGMRQSVARVRKVRIQGTYNTLSVISHYRFT